MLRTEPRPGAAQQPASSSEAAAGHVVLFGIGAVGGEVMLRLCEAGIPVIAVDRTPDDRSRQLADRHGVTLIPGDITLPEVFDQLQLASARSFISCTSDDKTNLQVALMVHDARSDLPTVVRLNNDNLGRQLEARFPAWRVLGLPALSSPSFVASALSPESRRCWRVGDELLAVIEMPIEEPRLVREIADVTPLYVRRELGAIEHWPPPPTPLAPGDRLGIVANVARLPELSAATGDGLDDPVRSGWLVQLGRRVGGILADADRRLIGALGFAIAIAWLSVFVFVEYKGLTVPQAIYFVVTTMATVGYGDINLSEDSSWLKFYGVGVMLVSMMVVSVLTAFVTNWVLSARLTRLFGSQRSHALGHVIVCGLGQVGFRIMEELRRVAPDTVGIDVGGGESLGSAAMQTGATIISGDARQRDVWARANIEGARSIVVTTSDDLANLETALSAREVNPRVRIVVRLFDADFAARVESTFDVDSVLSPAALAAPFFAAAALGGSVADRFTIDGFEYLFVRMHVEPGSAWVGATIGDLTRNRDAVVLAHEPAIGRARVRPSQRIPLRPGDVVALVCSPAAWDGVRAEG